MSATISHNNTDMTITTTAEGLTIITKTTIAALIIIIIQTIITRSINIAIGEEAMEAIEIINPIKKDVDIDKIVIYC